MDRQTSGFPPQALSAHALSIGLIYRVDGDLIRILAVAHLRQLPGYWRSRE